MYRVQQTIDYYSDNKVALIFAVAFWMVVIGLVLYAFGVHWIVPVPGDGPSQPDCGPYGPYGSPTCE